MKLKIHSLRCILITILLFSIANAWAQPESTNVFKYTIPAGFKKSKLEGKTEFYFKKDKKWVVIDLFDIRPSNGNAAEDAQKDWNELVVPNYVVKGDIVTERHEQDGWQITARTTVTSIIKYNLSLVTFSCSSGHASVLLTNNDFQNMLDTETGAFIGSLSLINPDEALAFIKPRLNNLSGNPANFPASGMSNQSAATHPVSGFDNQQNAYRVQENPVAASENFVPEVAPNPYRPPFPTPGEQAIKASIMMDVGWFVEATDDYIQYTKSDIKVIQYFYVAPEDPNSNTPDEDLFWRKYLSQYFSTASYNKYPNDPYDLLTRIEFASCNAVYRPNGQQYFIAWLVDLHHSACSYLAITSSEQVYRSYFPHPDDLGAMNRFNNFPVDAQQIQGEWADSNFGGAQMYEVNTGNYAGMSFASSASSFTFTGNNFRFSAKGATGMVGTAAVFQTVETGTFEVNGYSLVANIVSRTDQKTNTTIPKQEQVAYSVAFKFAKRAKILYMQNKQFSSMVYNLVRKL